MQSKLVPKIFFVLVSLVMAFSGCQKETEQDRVKTVITSVQKSAEEKDIRGIIRNISKAYTDPRGNDFDTIKALLLGYFYQHPKISASIVNLEAKIDNTAAQATFQAVLTGGNKTGSVADIIPESLGMYAFEVSLRKEDNEWKVLSAKWERVGD